MSTWCKKADCRRKISSFRKKSQETDKETLIYPQLSGFVKALLRVYNHGPLGTPKPGYHHESVRNKGKIFSGGYMFSTQIT